MKKVVMSIILAVLVLSTIIFLINNSKKEPTILESKEIREYQGEQLSSIYDFRENSIKGVQYIDIKNYTLKVTGLVEEEKEYTYDEVISRPSYAKVVTLHCVEGWDATILWQGIILRDLLKEAKPLENASIIIFRAYDGYATNYPSEYIMNKDILLAYKMNNETIIPERGFPFQLVAEDKWGYKWIKWVTEIEFSDDENYRGFWEDKGYSNQGNLNETFLE